MAKDREIEQIETSNNEYDVNSYTIQYDSKAKRFFKGFTPKVVSGGLISTVVFAGLGVFTVLTGGIAGVGVGAIAGASVALGTTLQTAYSGINYRRNSARARFKSLGIGGKEDDVGTIGIIEECESQAYQYTQLLEDYPSQDKFVLQDGATYSRRDLKKRIKENEDIAYHGLKYILDQGMYVSEQLNALRKKKVLTEREEEKREKYWDMMDRISESVKKVVSKRLNFNPYKNLIIGYIQQGCLLGNYEQNNQIRAVATSNNRDKAIELYSNMYELPLLEGIKEERKATRESLEEIQEDNKKVIRTRKELIQHDGKIEKVSKENQKLAKEINKLNVYYVLISHANSILKAIPDELANEKVMLTNSIKGLKTAVESNDKEAMHANEGALSQLVDDISKKLITVSANQKVKDQAQKQINAYKKVLLKQKAEIGKLEDAVEVAQDVAYDINQQLNKSNARYAGAVKRNISKTYENKNLRKRAEDAEATVKVLYDDNLALESELNNATQGWYEANKRADKQTKKYEGAVKRNINSRAQAKYWQDKAENAEQAVEVLNDAYVDTNEQLKQAKKDNQKVRTKKNRATRIIENLVHSYENQTEENRVLKVRKNHSDAMLAGYMQENDQLRTDLDHAQATAYDEHLQGEQLRADYENAANVAFETGVQLNKANDKNAKTTKGLSKANVTIKNQARQIKKLETAVDHAQATAYDEHLQGEHLRKRAEDAENTVGALYGNLKAESEAREKIEQENKGLRAYKKRASGKLARATQKAREDKETINRQARKINDLNEDVTNLVNAQNENINKIMDLEGDNDILLEKLQTETKRAKVNEDLAINLALSQRKMEKDLAELVSDRDAYKEMAEDGQDTIDKLRQEIDDIKEKELENATQEEINLYFQVLKMQTGRVRKDFTNKVNELEQRVVLTKETNTGLSQYLDDLLKYVDYARDIDLEKKDLEELKDMYGTVKLLYDANDKALVKLPKKTINKITKVIDGIEVVVTTEQKTSVKVGR